MGGERMKDIWLNKNTFISLCDTPDQQLEVNGASGDLITTAGLARCGSRKMENRENAKTQIRQFGKHLKNGAAKTHYEIQNRNNRRSFADTSQRHTIA
jgi:hypothetical protein